VLEEEWGKKQEKERERIKTGRRRFFTRVSVFLKTKEERDRINTIGRG
jgi:hypothetical protein